MQLPATEIAGGGSLKGLATNGRCMTRSTVIGQEALLASDLSVAESADRCNGVCLRWTAGELAAFFAA